MHLEVHWNPIFLVQMCTQMRFAHMVDTPMQAIASLCIYAVNKA